MTQSPEARHWDTWAKDYGNNEWRHFGSAFFARMRGGEKPVVAVRLIEDAEGPYHGWLKTGEDTPCMIWPSAIQLEMCFPYGMAAAIGKGGGQPIRLRCEPRLEENEPEN